MVGANVPTEPQNSEKNKNLVKIHQKSVENQCKNLCFLVIVLPLGAWGGLHTVPQPKTSNPRASPELKIHQKSIKSHDSSIKRTYQGRNIWDDPIIEKSQDQDQGQGQGQD